MTRKNTIQLASVSSIATICLLAALTAGCENADTTPDVSWNGVATQNATPAQTAAPTPAPTSGEPSAPTAGGTDGTGSTGGVPGVNAYADAVPHGSLDYRFGGFSGRGASHSGVNIAGLSFSKGGLSFRYVNDLSAWGLSNGQIGGIACLFVQTSAGNWVGGKFDWISSSRTTRGFENVFHGYEGWSLAGVPNPCQAAFVIVSANGSKRSNVLVGTWSR